MQLQGENFFSNLTLYGVTLENGVLLDTVSHCAKTRCNAILSSLGYLIVNYAVCYMIIASFQNIFKLTSCI